MMAHIFLVHIAPVVLLLAGNAGVTGNLYSCVNEDALLPRHG